MMLYTTAVSILRSHCL